MSDYETWFAGERNRKMRKEPRTMTAAEKRWVERLRKVLGECPPTLELATQGDASVGVWCKRRRKAVYTAGGEMCDGGAEFTGAKLATVSSACLIHGVSG